MTISLDSELLHRLEQHARAHGISLDDESRGGLETAARMPVGDPLALAEEVSRKLAGRPHSDSTLLIAQDRER